jgi:phosphoesterase RecJ-like protein
MQTYEEKLKIAYKKIFGAKNILLVSHTSPDADALSSLAAIIEILREKKINFYAFADKKKDAEYPFIPNEQFINSEAPKSLNAFDVVVILDCGSLSRTGIENLIINSIATRESSNKPFFIELDHHEKISNYADLEIRRQDKASTTSLVHDLLKINGVNINKAISDCILSGLMSDTGCFLHSNSTAEAIALASDMLSYGASFHKIIRATTKNSNFISLKTWGKIIENLYFDKTSGLASSGLSQAELEEIKKSGAENDEKELAADLFGVIVSFICSFEGVKVALLLREENGIVKGSLRTNGEHFDVAKIASQFGGGGHKKAAGFSIKGHLIKTEKGWKVKK